MTRRPLQRSLSVLFLAAAAVVAAVVAAVPASALPESEIGIFPSWSIAGGEAAATFEATSPPPALTVATDASSFGQATGRSAFLGSDTAFGNEFGSSRAQPYLTVGRNGTAYSTTTVSFDAAPDREWGLALGDIDADWVFLQAFDAAGNPVSSASDLSALGYQGVGNYCNNSPKPSGCPAGTSTDEPQWITSPQSIESTCVGAPSTVDYVPGTLRGNVTDTAGAYGWFKPEPNVAEIRLTFGATCGIPTYQIWVAGSTPSATITGTVDVQLAPGSAGPSEPIVAELTWPGGDPVLDAAEEPVTVPVGADGRFEFEAPINDEPLEIAFRTPEGFGVIPPITVTPNASAISLPAVTVEYSDGTEPAPSVTPSASPAPSVSAEPSPTDSASPDDGVEAAADSAPASELADTGASAGALWAISLGSAAALATGAGLVHRSRQRNSLYNG